MRAASYILAKEVGWPGYESVLTTFLLYTIGLFRFDRSHSLKYSSSPLESRKRVQHKVGNFVLDKSGTRQGFFGGFATNNVHSSSQPF